MSGTVVKLNIDILIPLADRPSIWNAVRSLRQFACHFRRIIIPDSSLDAAYAQSLHKLQMNGEIIIKTFPSCIFHKTFLLNRALEISDADIILITDADIIWAKDAFLEMLDETLSFQCLTHLQNVQESRPTTPAANRPGYTYELERPNATLVLVHIVPRRRARGIRGGPGTVMAHRSIFVNLGGYNEEIIGWGWDDKDLLMRAEILGFQVHRRGNALHESHDDCDRVLAPGARSIAGSRNRNLMRAVNRVAGGALRGHLRDTPALLRSIHPKGLTIKVILPPELIQFGNQFMP